MSELQAIGQKHDMRRVGWADPARFRPLAAGAARIAQMGELTTAKRAFPRFDASRPMQVMLMSSARQSRIALQATLLCSGDCDRPQGLIMQNIDQRAGVI